MGRIPEEDVQRVRDATDIAALVGETVQLRRKGRLLWGLCPFHDEKTPSFKVDAAAGLWHCFGCNVGGDVFGFLMLAENLEFPDAVRLLAERANIEVRDEGGDSQSRSLRERVVAACEEAADLYHRCLTTSQDEGAERAREYLRGRGFGSEVAKRFRLGYAPGHGTLVRHLTERGFTATELSAADLAVGSDRGGLRDRFYERVVFPIQDLRGRCIGFGGRVLGEGHPKYLNSSDTPAFRKSANLYALEKAKNEIVRREEAVVVEGYTDVIALHEAGIANAVATLGTALTEQHVRMLGRFAPRVVYLFDGDEAGLRAADRAADMADWRALSEGAEVAGDLAVALIPQGGDPADFVSQRGAEEMSSVIAKAVPLARYALDRRLGRHDLETPEGRAKALMEAAAFLAPMGQTLLGQDYARYVADRLGTDPGTVARATRKAAGRPSGRQAAVGGGSEGRPPGTGEDGEAASGRTLLRAPSDPQERAELEVLRLAAGAPGIRGEARELLAQGLLSSATLKGLLGLVLDAGDLVGGELYALVRERDPQGATTLTGVMLETTLPARPDLALKELSGKLKEYSVQRLILEKKRDMASLDPRGDRDRRDEMFREIAELTLRLERVRRGETGTGE